MEKLTFNKLGQWALSKGWQPSDEDIVNQYADDTHDHSLGMERDADGVHRITDPHRQSTISHAEADRSAQNDSFESGDLDHHLGLSKNPKLHPELQHKLLNTYDKDSAVYNNLSRNQGLTVDAQHRMADANDPFINLNLARNPSLHPTVKPKLGL